MKRGDGKKWKGEGKNKLTTTGTILKAATATVAVTEDLIITIAAPVITAATLEVLTAVLIVPAITSASIAAAVVVSAVAVLNVL